MTAPHVTEGTPTVNPPATKGQAQGERHPEPGADEARPAAGTRHRARHCAADWIGLVALVLFCYAGIGAASAHSVVPWIGPWSRGLAATIAALAFLLALGSIGWARRNNGLLTLSLAGLVLTSLALSANRQVREWPGIGFVLPAGRGAFGLYLVAVQFERFRVCRSVQRGWLAAGAFVVAWSLADLALAGWILWRYSPSQRARVSTEFRDDYELSAITGNDLVLVGDSYVWGAGVTPQERFGDLLQRRWSSADSTGRIYSLGVNGADLDEYEQIIAELPEASPARAVVLALYLNDFERVPDWRDTLIGLCSSLRHGSPTLGLVGDRLAQWVTPSAEADQESIVRRFDRRDPTYAYRLGLCEQALARCYGLARPRSIAHPVLLILPMMTDFERYPLLGAHEDLIQAGRKAGFECLDVLPDFRDKLVDGRRHWARHDDHHFDADAHRVLANYLWSLGPPFSR